MAVPRTSLSLALVVSAALALAGCSAGGSASGSASASSDAGGNAAAAAGGSAEAKAPAGALASQAPQSQQGAAPATVVKQRVIRTAQVVVQVDGELAPAAAKVRAIAQGLGGTVASETTTYADSSDPGTTTNGGDPSPTSGDSSSSATATAPAGAAGAAGAGPVKAAHPGQSLLVLRVPEGSLDQALSQITGSAGVGKELSRSANAQDVTGDLADLQSRVATQRASVERIRALLGKAGSLRDVVLLESEVTKREADLEALEARQAALADRADLATLTVDLRTAAAVAAAPAEKKQNAFLDGLNSGWDALVASMTVILTVLGALLPLAIVLLLVGGPLLWVVRRRRRPVAPAPAPTPSPGAGT